MLNKIGRIVRRLSGTEHVRKSYSQSGEDLILSFLLSDILGIQYPTYLDIGAHHPRSLSNTYYFYRRGSAGVCVEPDPLLVTRFDKARPRDVRLPVGIAIDERRSATLYRFSDPGFNTFSEEQMRRTQALPHMSLLGQVEVKLVPVNEVLAAHFAPAPDFISVDTEGFDLPILKTVDFERFRPIAICVEAIESDTWERIPEIPEFLDEVGYEVFADTNLNLIFVDSKVWRDRLAARRENCQ